MGTLWQCSPMDRQLRRLNGGGRLGTLWAAAAATILLLALGQPAATQQNPAAVNALWVAESAGVLKVATADGSLLLELPGLAEVRAVAVDHHRPTIWLFAGQSLYAYGYDGKQQLAVPVSLPNPASVSLAVNEHDGSIWVGANQNLLSVSVSGQQLNAFRLPDNVKSLGIDPSGALLWVGTANSAAAYDAIAGTEVASLALGASPDLRDLDVDPAGKVWVALGAGVRRYAEDGTLLLAVTVADPQHVAGDSHGGAWVATSKALFQVSAAGQLSSPISPFDGEATIVEVVVDPSNDNAWLANATAVAQVDATGHLVRAFQFQPPVHIWDLALYADTIPPELAITTPADGSYVSTKSPTLAISYSDIGSGVNPSALAFTANGAALAVRCSPGGTGAVCTVANPLAEGGVTVTATVKDYAGNTAQPATVTFTVDTTPPVITITSPANGLVTNQRQQLVAGTLSEPATFTVNGAAAVVGANLSFAQSITLQEGLNSIVVVATDRAGNLAQATVQVTLDTIPPTPVAAQAVTVTAPSGGSSTVSAGPRSAKTGATVLLTDLTTGAMASTTVGADGSFSTSIACRAGDSIQIVLRDAAGNSSAPTTVTVPGPTGNGLPPDPATVATPIDRTVVTDFAAATAFLYTGPNAIQQGVHPGAVDPFIVAVLRGSVHDRSGQPIPGVKVTVLSHPELGGTLTRADGVFDLAANGGGLLTVQFAKDGFLTAQRQVNAPWRDYAWLSDVVLVPLDSTSTFVDTTLTTMQVIRGITVQDRDGSRQATLLFPAGTTAQLVRPGGQTYPLPALTVRATEYTVGATGAQAMPAPLPPSTAYTYAVELSADEAAGTGASVQFSQPLAFYLENFLGFPVGGNVPAGYYDRGQGAWIASDNGRVVKILSVTGGLADLDITGAGTPADATALAALGISPDERQSLAALYTVGQSLWRVPLRHFTAWDFNWWPEIPPDFVPPPDPNHDPPKDLPDPCEQAGASVIDCENQALGEDVPIVGTPFTMHYQSDRMPGRVDARSVRITLTGPNPPSTLVRIDLSISVAGRRFLQSFAPAVNLTTTFAWDGMDAYGRLLQGAGQPVTVTVSYVYYPGYSYYPALVFGQLPVGWNLGVNPATVIPNPGQRFELPLTQTYTTQIGLMDASVDKFGGWTLSVHHQYDAGTRTLWRGDGSRENGDAIATDALEDVGVISTQPIGIQLVADGSVDVNAVSGIASVDRNGDVTYLYLGVGESISVDATARDRFNQLFFRTCHVFYTPGLGYVYRTEIRTPSAYAYSSQLVFSLPTVQCGYSNDFVSDNAGGFYLVGTLAANCPGPACSNSLLHLGADGGVTTLVDSTLVPQFFAGSVALGPDGSLYFGDWYGGRLFRLAASGALTVMAGSGTSGFSGDGGPAVDAQIEGPVGIAVAADGTLWITDGGRLRHIDASGFIRTVAGGFPNSPPDVGVLASNVAFFSRVALDPNGVLYFNGGGFPGAWPVWRIGNPFPGFGTNSFVVAAENGGEAYEFSADGRHLRTLDPVTGAVLYRFTYNQANLLTGVVDRDGRLTPIERDAQGNATAIVSPDGQRTTLTMGNDGYLATVANPAAETRSFTYAPAGLLATQIDPRGFKSTYQYSSDGRLVLDTDAVGGFKSLQRTAAPGFNSITMTTGAGDTSQFAVQYPASGGRLRLFTGADGVTARSLIAANGQQTTTWPDGSVVTTTLGSDPRFGLQSPIVASEQTRMPSGLTMTTSASRAASLTTPGDPLSVNVLTETWTMNGNTFTQVFDRSRMQWSFQTPTGRRFVQTVNAAGRPTSQQVATLAPIQFTYDASGRLISAAQGSGQAQRALGFTYGTDGRLGAFTDPLRRTFSFVWDTAGRLTSRMFPDGRVVAFGYDPAGNLASVTPPGRPRHTFTFTPVNLQNSYTPPDLGGGPTTTTYAYDLDRRLTSVSRPDGNTVAFTYQQGHLAAVKTPQGTISLIYDPATSHLQSVSAPGGEITTYTSDGPLPIRTSWSGPVAASVESSFNPDFRVSAQTVNGQYPIAFLYDPDGLLIQAGNMYLNRDPSNGLITGTTLGLITTAEVQNAFGELSSYSAAYAGSELFRTDLTRDLGGRVTHKIETILGTANTFDYGYDAAGRLTDVLLNGAPLSHYDYDSNSNRTSTRDGTTVTLASYDVQDRLVQWGNVTYAYDANGNLASKAQNGSIISYVYDQLGNLVKMVDVNGTETDYLVDGQNLRVGKQVAGIPVQGFVWQDPLRPAAELDGSGNIISRFIYPSDTNVPDYIFKGANLYRIITDELGSPRLAIDSATGQIAQRMDFDAWGRVTLDTNPGFQPFGFAGGLYDQGTGLVRFGRRDYDAAVGRWTSQDPIGFAGGDVNLYGYALTDPVNLTDPSGLATYECTRPLKTLGPWGGTRKTGPDIPGNPLYHKWLCVVDGQVIVCGEHNHDDTGSPWGAPGKDLGPKFDPSLCRKAYPDNRCLEDCLKRQFALPRPWYNWIGIGGESCKDWADKILETCRDSCILAAGGG